MSGALAHKINDFRTLFPLCDKTFSDWLITSLAPNLRSASAITSKMACKIYASYHEWGRFHCLKCLFVRNIKRYTQSNEFLGQLIDLETDKPCKGDLEIQDLGEVLLKKKKAVFQMPCWARLESQASWIFPTAVLQKCQIRYGESTWMFRLKQGTFRLIVLTVINGGR